MSTLDLEAKMSDDLKAVLRECKSGNIAIVNGSMIEAAPDEVAFIMMMDKEIYNSLFAIAASSGEDPETLVMRKIHDVISDTESDEIEDDVFDKYASESSHEIGEPEEESHAFWDDPSDPPPTDDEDPGFIGWGAGTLSEKTNPSVENRNIIDRTSHKSVFDQFKKILTKIHSKSDGSVRISVDFSIPGEALLDVKYPEDGVEMLEACDGGIDNAMSQVNSYLKKFFDIAFAPKLESETPVVTSLNAKIVEFDKGVGKYLVQIGDDMLVHVSPEDISKVVISE